MENKYYLNKEGLDKLVEELSDSIKRHTSGQISCEQKVIFDFETGTTIIGYEKTDKIIDPNNLVTAKAVVDFLKKRDKLTINQDFTTETPEAYDISTTSYQYNGEEAKQINFNLISSTEIDNLF